MTPDATILTSNLACTAHGCEKGLCRSLVQLTLAAAHEVPPECPNRVSFADLAYETHRSLHGAEPVVTPHAGTVLSLQPLAGQTATIAANLRDGRLVLLEPRVKHPIRGGSKPRPPVDPEPGKVDPPKRTSFVKIRVVDFWTGVPIPNVTLLVVPQRGVAIVERTRVDGMVEVNDIDPGTVDVTCDLKNARLDDTWTFVDVDSNPTAAMLATPSRADMEEARRRDQFIALVHEHKVQTGETLETIAATHGMTERDLALFNFGTTDPREVNERLFGDVGATKQAPDGGFVLDSADDPGIVFVPKKWFVAGLATEQTHVIRVKQPVFKVILQNLFKFRLPQADFEATLVDNSKRRGRVGKTGIALLRDLPAGPVTVEWPDHDDVVSKSLAACARAAFDEHDHQEIFHVLMQSPTLVQKMSIAYDNFYNNYTGKGFVEDVYHDITEPAALMAAEVLMARGGLQTRQPMNVTEPEGVHAG